MTFLGAVTLRNFLEMYSDNESVSAVLFVHYYLSYICLAAALIILFARATRQSAAVTARVVLPSFIILLLAPAIDLILYPGYGYDISYMLPGIHEDLLFRFFTFFGPLDVFGVSPGMRIEIACVLIISGIYFYVKTLSIIRSLVYVLLMYTVIFLYGIAPYGAKHMLSLAGLSYSYSPILMRNFYLTVLLFLGPALLYCYNPRYSRALVKDIRLLRVLHFEIMFIIGILFFTPRTDWGHDFFFSLICLPAAVLFGCLFSLITNNLADYETDKISNPSRPTVSGSIPIDRYRKLGWLFFALSLCYALAAGFGHLFFILLFISGYVFYSLPPFRVKRVPVVSKICISFNSLVLFIMGYTLAGGTMEIPWQIPLFFLIFFTGACNVIDLKDREGDAAAGIKTLPVLLGMRLSKVIIGGFVFLSYALSFMPLNRPELITPSVIIGLVQCYLINRTPYREKPVLIVYIMSVAALVAYLYICG